MAASAAGSLATMASRSLAGPPPQEAPIEPLVDLATHPTRPRRPDAVPAEMPAKSAMLRVGAEVSSLFLEAQKTTLASLRVLDHSGTVIGGRDEVGMSLAHVEEVREAMQGRYASALRKRLPDHPAPPLASLSRGTGVRIFSALPVISGDRLLGIIYLANAQQHPPPYVRDARPVRPGRAHHSRPDAAARMGDDADARAANQPAGCAGAATRARQSQRARASRSLRHQGARRARSQLSGARSLDGHAQYIRDFAAHVSHEFKGPLSAIRGWLSCCRSTCRT